jgi:hypothetical protein
MNRSFSVHSLITGVLCVALAVQICWMWRLRNDLSEARRDIRTLGKRLQEQAVSSRVSSQDQHGALTGIDRLPVLQARIEALETQFAKNNADRMIEDVVKSVEYIAKQNAEIDERIRAVEIRYRGLEAGYRSNNENLMRILMGEIEHLKDEVDKKVSR